MSDTNLPDKKGTGGDAALSYDEGADAISDILNPEPDLEDEDQAQDAEEEGETDAEEGDDAEEAEDAETDEEDPDAEADETDVDAEDEDGPGGYDGGKFASDDAKVTLKDGSVISVQDLKRGYISQQSFTRGTQEVAEKRKELEAKRSEVDNFAQQIAQQRDFILQVSQHLLPKPPDKSLRETDFIGYRNAMDDYQEQMQVLGQLQQQKQAQDAYLQQQETAAQQEKRQQEAEMLLDAMPELKKPDRYQKFWNDTVDVMAEYGWTPEELNQAMDHRFYLVFRDLQELKRIKRAAPKAKERVKGKPVLKAGKRMDPKAKTSREKDARHERLRKTGDFDAGVSALMDLDL